MKYSIDTIQVINGTLRITGWAIGQKISDIVEYRIETADRQEVKFHLVTAKRNDVMREMFRENAEYRHGFTIKFECDEQSVYRLIFSCGEKKMTETLNPAKLVRQGEQAPTILSKLCRLLKPSTIGNAFAYLKEHGVRQFWKKVVRTLNRTKREYDHWRKQVMSDSEELERQRKESFAYRPKFSIIVPVFRTPEKVLREMIDSVRAQTYSNWELCLADGSGEGSHTFAILENYTRKDPRIRYDILQKNEGISGNTNAALKMVTGDYVVLADHDDTLTPDALYYCAKALNRPIRPDVVYSDEDKVSPNGLVYSEPHFKSDFNPDYLRSGNYICHLFVVAKDLVDRIGAFRSEYDGAQDFDFILRCTEQAKEIYHIPRVLYHWRISETSTAANPDNKRYAFEAGIKAVQAHCERMGYEAKVEHGQMPGYYRTTYALKETPLISVIIPTKDHRDDLKKCLESFFAKCTYPNLEFIIVENNSTEPETFAYYEEVQAAHSNVKVVVWENTGFNYSKINNYGVSFAKGKYLLFLNNDIELLEKNSIEEMLSYCQRDDVGIVGARLLFPDDTIQHAGVVIGLGGVAGHPFVGMYVKDLSYFLRASTVQNYSAVTAACMMTKRELFDQVGGFCEELAVAFNDIDYCMKVRKIGKLVVYTPFATLYHYESKSRGRDDSTEKMRRFESEVELFSKRWPEILENGDPYYNINLTREEPNYDLRDWRAIPK